MAISSPFQGEDYGFEPRPRRMRVIEGVLVVCSLAAIGLLWYTISNVVKSGFWSVTRGYTQHDHCPICFGTGRVRWYTPKCPNCQGDGLVPASHERPTLKMWRKDHPSAGMHD